MLLDGCLAVGLAVLEAGVEDAGPAVDELAQRLAWVLLRAELVAVVARRLMMG